jgi:hypothetical protein
MISADQIEKVISAYVADRDLRKFVLEFSRLSFNVRNNGQPKAIKLAKDVECKLAELHVGHASEDMFRDWMEELVRKPVAANSYISASQVFVVSVNRLVEERAFPEVPVLAHTSPGVVFGLATPLQV